MKNALISPEEFVQSGYRVAEVTEASFEIAKPLFWAVCEDNVVADKFWFDPTDQIIKPIPDAPLPIIIPATNQPVVTGATTL